MLAGEWAGIWYGYGMGDQWYHLPARQGDIDLTGQREQLKLSVVKELGQRAMCLVEGRVGLPVTMSLLTTHCSPKTVAGNVFFLS